MVFCLPLLNRCILEKFDLLHIIDNPETTESIMVAVILNCGSLMLQNTGTYMGKEATFKGFIRGWAKKNAVTKLVQALILIMIFVK